MSKHFDFDPEIRKLGFYQDIRNLNRNKTTDIQMGKLNIINTYHRTYWDRLTHLEKQIKNKQNNNKKRIKEVIFPKIIQLLNCYKNRHSERTFNYRYIC